MALETLRTADKITWTLLANQADYAEWDSVEGAAFGTQPPEYPAFVRIFESYNPGDGIYVYLTMDDVVWMARDLGRAGGLVRATRRPGSTQ